MNDRAQGAVVADCAPAETVTGGLIDVGGAIAEFAHGAAVTGCALVEVGAEGLMDDEDDMPLGREFAHGARVPSLIGIALVVLG